MSQLSTSQPTSAGSPGSEERIFHLFPKLPPEIRSQIWFGTLVSHIVRWIRVDDNASSSSNVFPYSPQYDPIFHVSHEARQSGWVLGNYVALGPNENVLYSPTIDYLYLDPAWRHLLAPQLQNDPLRSLPFDTTHIRKIMINPNYTDDRLKPGVCLENLPNLEEVLIVADEKTVGLKDKFMLASVYDLVKYFDGIKRKFPLTKIPYIAIGCLGWVGEERTRLSHRSENRRQLIAVLRSNAELKEHQLRMRDEEKIFLQSTFNRKKRGFKLNFRPGYGMDGLPESASGTKDDSKDVMIDSLQDDSMSSRDSGGLSNPPPEDPPTYSQAISEQDSEIRDAFHTSALW